MCHGNPPFRVPGLSGSVVWMPYKRRKTQTLQPREEKCQVKNFLSPPTSFFNKARLLGQL
jgi:hypothetical protein